MSRRHLSLLLLRAMAWVGCSPTFNWRAVQLEQAPALRALLPCKPDRGSRVTSLLGQAVWFAHQGQLFHAVVYAEHLSPALADTFFAPG